MSMYDDSELSGRFAALAPEPLSGNWDEVLDRAGMARNGRQRFERSRAVPGRRRRLVVVLAVLAVATAAATAGWAIVREVVLHKSFIGLPPVGATRSAPESGELVIQYWIDPDGLTAGGRGWVYADGRLITLRGSGFLEQRLTPEGVELLRSELVSTGLFDHHQPAGRGGSPHGVIQVRIGERLVRVQGCPGCPVNFPERLGERLADAASWLPPSAWKDRQIRAYVASRYTISYFAQPQTLERSRILSLLPAAAEDLLRDKDTVPEQWYTPGCAAGPLGGCTDSAGHKVFSITNYVSYLTTEEARALAQALDDAGLKQEPANRGELGYRFEIPGTSVDPPPPEKGRVRNEVFIYFEPSLPDGEHVCSACG
jgi:hypothetical protein